MTGQDQRRSLIQEFASRLKYPQLFFIMAALFGLDLLIPDFIPFLDEILLGLGTVMLGMWKQDRFEGKPPEKNVTPRRELPEGGAEPGAED